MMRRPDNMPARLDRSCPLFDQVFFGLMRADSDMAFPRRAIVIKVKGENAKRARAVRVEES